MMTDHKPCLGWQSPKGTRAFMSTADVFACCVLYHVMLLIDIYWDNAISASPCLKLLIAHSWFSPPPLRAVAHFVYVCICVSSHYPSLSVFVLVALTYPRLLAHAAPKTVVLPKRQCHPSPFRLQRRAFSQTKLSQTFTFLLLLLSIFCHHSLAMLPHPSPPCCLLTRVACLLAQAAPNRRPSQASKSTILFATSCFFPFDNCWCCKLFTCVAEPNVAQLLPSLQGVFTTPCSHTCSNNTCTICWESVTCLGHIRHI